jgi:hypothetical protein
MPKKYVELHKLLRHWCNLICCPSAGILMPLDYRIMMFEPLDYRIMMFENSERQYHTHH